MIFDWHLHHGAKQRELMAALSIGTYRANRAMEGRPKQKVGGKKGHANTLTDHDRDYVRNLLRRCAAGNDWICCGYLLEPGLPCSHKQLPLYWKDGVTMKKVHAAYVTEVAALPSDQQPRTIKYAQFTTLFNRFHPQVKPHRLKEDICDACTRIDALIESEGISAEAKAALLLQKETHVDGARAQRRFVAECVAVQFQS